MRIKKPSLPAKPTINKVMILFLIFWFWLNLVNVYTNLPTYTPYAYKLEASQSSPFLDNRLEYTY